jgi:uncharacterized protein involved in exopolysaccharide biosynthesis
MSGARAIKALTLAARHKRMFLIVECVAIFLGLVYSLSLRNQYAAVTKIMPPKQTPSTTSFLNTQIGVGSLAEAAGGGLLKDPNAIYIGLLKSRPIADAIIDKFDLLKVYRAKDMTAARKKLESATVVVSEKSGLISVSVSDQDKMRAAEMANTYTEQLRLLSKSISFTEASRRRLFFEEKLKEAKEDLTAEEALVQQLQQNKGLVHLDIQSSVIIGSLAGVRSQIATKQLQIQTFRSYATERNPDLQLAERELSILQGEAAQLGQHGNASQFSEMGLKDVPEAGLEYMRDLRELQRRQAYYEMLMRQYEAASLDEAKDAAVIQIVESALPPDRKSSPHRAYIVLLFAFLGLVAAALHLHVADSVQRNPEVRELLAGLRTALARR